jgi:hypothetical protein
MEVVMRIIAAVLISAAALAWSAPVSAREYPWCAFYGFFGDDGTNCGFDTFQQCLATIHGVGGTCRENPMFFQAPRAKATKKRRKPHN